jgi:hypothetical protein
MEKSDNELIAEFMGMEHCKNADCIAANNLHWNTGHEFIPRASLKYDKSWDWLMPVVEKIAEYRLTYPEQTAKVCDMKIVVGIQYLHAAVVNFIKFYNTTKQ